MILFGATSQRLQGLKLQKLDLRLHPLQVFRALRREYQDVFLLESSAGPRRLAEYSFIGFDPALLIEVHYGFSKIVYEGGSTNEHEGDPLTLFHELVRPLKDAPQSPRFIGGLVGYASYDASFLWEDLSMRDKCDDGFPLMKFGLFKDVLIYDHRAKTYYSSIEEDRLSMLLGLLRDEDSAPELGQLQFSPFRSNLSKDDFMEIVEAGKKHIECGDVFQVVLSRRLELESSGDLLSFYLKLKELNPSPYMYYLMIGGDEIIGASPEMLVRVEGDRVMTFPIAGTRPRIDDPNLEEKSDLELLSDEKERAEHVMLVDLARNDLGKVAEPGTVEVKEFMTLVKYSHVKHLVSRVEAKLRRSSTMYDAFRAVFPAGTVSGAPKPRAMELIEELEPVRRGPYAGAVGYFSLNGCCDFAITIRTLIKRQCFTTIQAGAGIVWDSVPEREWMETQHKMTALIRALEEARKECES